MVMELSENKKIDTKFSLIMKSLTEFYKDPKYILIIRDIVDQKSVISLRVLDWFVVNYAKKHKIIINNGFRFFDVYQEYKLQLRAYSKGFLDIFNRKNKIQFHYGEQECEFIETSCGQLCFFRWLFQNNIIEYVEKYLDIIETDMKDSLRVKKDSLKKCTVQKRSPLSMPASRSITKQNQRITLNFD